jgi:hypothetical protein
MEAKRTLAALGLLRPLAKEVDALEVMAAIVSVFRLELMLGKCRACYHVHG